MNNNKLTGEQMNLDTAIAHADERAAALSGPCSTEHAQLASWLRELPERRKADSEPVGIFAKRNGTWLELCSGDTFEHPDAVKLFAAPPAPVVPDEKPMPEASKMHAIDAVAAIAEVRGWNACRAAMLQAGSHLVIGIDRASGPDRTGEIRYCAPPGYVMVPVEPTEKMVIEGFESEPDEFFSKSEEWDAYQEMSGCEQAAHRAKLCWAAMIKAAPKQENI
ncbi:TPA: hypothetical protein MNM99_003588 [Citrobacter freundii]|nr:hypothetical protein [Citrobacter freundii]HCA0719006.1 hypothetical protein [Citrobacter freundii]HCA1542891.1 hypothetical protein [Citrobacter freundii]HCA2005424.1 hypothetical protein [Citrobacter freundii]